MATTQAGHKAKRERMLRAAEIQMPTNEDYLQSYFFYKDEMRCVVAVYKNCILPDFYRDKNYNQHLDWNDKIIKGLTTELKNKVTILELASYLIENGWQPK
ncbi:MAG: hypothetical protein LBN95_06445 [Prevotellaceae bacterium]|jgi:hypothetical protein|nr:hypothetical protein [Prevotellaceae bacterium]